MYHHSPILLTTVGRQRGGCWELHVLSLIIIIIHYSLLIMRIKKEGTCAFIEIVREKDHCESKQHRPLQWPTNEEDRNAN